MPFTALFHVLAAVSGPILASGIFAYLAAVDQLTVALVGLIGTIISSLAGVCVALLNRREIRMVKRQVSSTRDQARKSADTLAHMAGDEKVSDDG